MTKLKNHVRLNMVKIMAATLLLMTTVNTSRAQDKNASQIEITYGLKAGATSSSFQTGAGNIWSKSGAAGFNIGAFARIGGRFYFQQELNYAQFSNQNSKDAMPFNPKFQAVNMALLGGFKIVEKSAFNIRVSGGPDIYYNYQGLVPAKGTDYRKYNLAQACGAGIDFGKLTFDARYSYGLTKINTVTSQKLNILSLAAGYKFK